MYAYYADSSALVSAGASASEEIVQVFPARQPKKPINYSKKVSAEESIDLLNSLFKEGEGALHHQSSCCSKSCCKLSAQGQTANKMLKTSSNMNGCLTKISHSTLIWGFGGFHI